jgi:hypothetical protein
VFIGRCVGGRLLMDKLELEFWRAFVWEIGIMLEI